MSKKQLLNRLENLFANIVEDAVEHPAVHSALPPVQSLWKWEADQSGCIISCEDTVKASLGYLPDEVIGQPITSFGLSRESEAELQNALQQDLFPVDLPVVFQSKSGSPVPIRLTIFKKFDPNGEKERFSWYCPTIIG